MAKKLPQKSRMDAASDIPHNNGHDRARLIYEGDPDGRPVVHAMVKTQRVIDALWADGKFRHGIGEKDDGKHLYDAATKLRELYERAAPAMGMSSVQDRNWSGGRRELIGDEGAWWSYNNAMRQIGQWKGVVRAVVIEDRTPEDYGRQYHCYGLSALTTGLERLARHFGIA